MFCADISFFGDIGNLVEFSCQESQNNLSTMLPHFSLFYSIFISVLDQYKLAMPL